MPIGIEIEKALIVSVASVMFPELLTLSSTMYPTEIVAAPADVDKVTPRPSSSVKPVFTSQSNCPTSPTRLPTVPPVEPGVSPNSTSPTTIVAPPVVKVTD